MSVASVAAESPSEFNDHNHFKKLLLLKQGLFYAPSFVDVINGFIIKKCGVGGKRWMLLIHDVLIEEPNDYEKTLSFLMTAFADHPYSQQQSL